MVTGSNWMPSLYIDGMHFRCKIYRLDDSVYFYSMLPFSTRSVQRCRYIHWGKSIRLNSQPAQRNEFTEIEHFFQYDRLPHIIYEIPWYHLTVSDQKLLTIFLLNSQSPKKFYLIGEKSMNVETGIAVCVSSDMSTIKAHWVFVPFLFFFRYSKLFTPLMSC